MTKISNKKHKFIKRNFKQLSIEDLSRQTGLRPKIVRALINEFSTETLKEDLSSAVYKSTNPISSKKQSFYIIGGAILIFIIIFMLYTPALKNEFINWDDDICIYENTHIRSLDVKSIQWMLTAFHAGNWHPLTWLSHAVVYNLWGLNPRMHHLINIIIHSLNTVLVFLLVIQLMFLWLTNVCTIPPASRKIAPVPQAILVGGITALLLGLHPLHVETVAWVTERKGLLCTFFLLLSYLSFLAYTSLAYRKRRLLWFGISLLLFLFALMSKPMAITFPLVLLLLDYYPLRRTGCDLRNYFILFLEKIPFFMLSLASGAVTIAAQESFGALQSFKQFNLTSQLLNALTSLTTYLGKIIWPYNLVPFYPLSVNLFNAWSLASGIVVLTMSLCSLVLARRGKPLLLIAWTYYVITLLPVLGIIQIGSHAAADRFTYLPSLSMYLLVGIGFALVFKRCVQLGRKGTLTGLIAMLICFFVLLSYLTFKQTRIWHDSEVFWSYVINMFPKEVPQAYNNLSWIYATSPDKLSRNGEKAVALATQACELTNFKKANHLDTLAAAYAEVGDFKLAIKHQQRAIQLARNEAKSGFLKRLELYQTGQPYRSQY